MVRAFAPATGLALALTMLGPAAGRASSSEPTAPAARAAPAEPSPALLRTTLIVESVARSIDFYERLGFRVESEMGGERSPDSPFPLNARSSRFRLVILQSAGGQGGRIGLLEFSEASPASTRRERRERVGLHDMVFVIDVPDAAAMHAKLVKAGAKVVGPPRVYVSRNRDAQGRPLEGRVFHVFDPDGYLIEMLEAPKPVSGGG